MEWGLKAKLLKAKFYINIMIRFEENKQNDHCSVMVEEKQYWNLKYEIFPLIIQDPLILYVYGLNIVNGEKG